MDRIDQIRDWILAQGLTEFNFKSLFNELCNQLAEEFPLYRVSLGMTTLHPLVEAKTIRWYRDAGLEFIESEHGYSNEEDWKLSPIYHMLANSLNELKFQLNQPGKWQQFPILEELAKAGCTDYFAQSVSFDGSNSVELNDTDGMLITWASDHPNGFSNDFFQAIDRLLPAIALLSKLKDRESALINILEAYLGRDAGTRVAHGQIERGELISINAVIWYSDMRDSTALADALSNQEFLDVLNAYFECTAGSVIECGGEVLRFIGNAVLAIFPVENFGTEQAAAQAAWQAAAATKQKLQATNQRRSEDQRCNLDFGLGLHAGVLSYGNIGTPTRLEFSVIGPVANEVARLESLTKTFRETVVVSEPFSQLLNIPWRYLGSPELKGVDKDFKVYAQA